MALSDLLLYFTSGPDYGSVVRYGKGMYYMAHLQGVQVVNNLMPTLCFAATDYTQYKTVPKGQVVGTIKDTVTAAYPAGTTPTVWLVLQDSTKSTFFVDPLDLDSDYLKSLKVPTQGEIEDKAVALSNNPLSSLFPDFANMGATLVTVAKYAGIAVGAYFGGRIILSLVNRKK